MVKTSANMWETFVNFEISHRMAQFLKLYSVILTYLLKAKKLKKCYIIETVNGKYVCVCDISIYRRLPSNSVIAKIVLRDNYLSFEGSNFLNFL